MSGNNIIIIGAGPAGSYLGYLLAKQGRKVTILEEHSQIGSPIQCTGIATSSIEKFLKLKKSIIANELGKVIVFSKSENISIDVNEVVLWRDKFDRYIAHMAEEEGANILLSHQFTGFGGKHSVKVKDRKENKTKHIKADIIVGADGVYSDVARAAGISQIKKYYTGMQAKVRLSIDASSFETYFGSDFPDFFGWCVPESGSIARLGVGCFGNAKEYFYRFLKSRTGKKEILCWQSGLIPLYNPKNTIQQGNVYLIGDAACQVKATTGGGIVPSLKAAQTLCDCIVSNKDYNSEFRKKCGRELLLHLKIRNALNRFSDKDYGRLLKLMNQEKVRKILKKYDRDTPIPLVANMLAKEPRLLYFLKVFLG